MSCIGASCVSAALSRWIQRSGEILSRGIENCKGDWRLFCPAGSRWSCSLPCEGSRAAAPLLREVDPRDKTSHTAAGCEAVRSIARLSDCFQGAPGRRDNEVPGDFGKVPGDR